jgi:GH18 family chitinase
MQRVDRPSLHKGHFNAIEFVFNNFFKISFGADQFHSIDTPKFRYLILFIVVSILFVACQVQTTSSPTPSEIIPTMTQSPPKPFRVVGYLTPSVDLKTIPYDKLTHINYAFFLPGANGNFEPIVNPGKLDAIVRESKIHDVKVLISAGGWGREGEFEGFTSDVDKRNVFVQNLVAFIRDHQLDGIDIDWEYPSLESSQNFLALMRELRAALPAGKLLTAAVASHGVNGDGIPAASFQYLDFINVMAYDGIEHASLNHAQIALDYWLSRGIPKGKLVLGVPFYSRPIAVPYRNLIQLESTAAYLDEMVYEGTTVSYNGIQSIKLKTEIALHRASGIMIWNLEYDSLDEETSLLSAIEETIKQTTSE